MIRAHQHAAAACGSSAEQEALGYHQGGFNSKIHLRCDDHGQPVTFLVTAGQRHEAVMFESLMEQGAVRRNGSGHPRIHPKRVEADKGYTGEPIKEKSALQILSSQSGIRAR
ncbi:MAG: transposase [Cyanobacteria bacterium J06627_8]